MTRRALFMGIALMVAMIAGSVANATIVFAGAGVVTLILWFLIDRLVPEGGNARLHR